MYGCDQVTFLVAYSATTSPPRQYAAAGEVDQCEHAERQDVARRGASASGADALGRACYAGADIPNDCLKAKSPISNDGAFRAIF